MRAGIYLDVENVKRTGGRAFCPGAIPRLVQAQGAAVICATAYVAVDPEEERRNHEYAKRKRAFREMLRQSGFRVAAKTVRWHTLADGRQVAKANADIDLAVDAISQGENLDYVLIVSGDGDFVPLVRHLQGRGRRVDVLAFGGLSRDLSAQADEVHLASLLPGILPPSAEGRLRGVLVDVRGTFGFLRVHLGLAPAETREDIFLHVSNFTLADGSRGTAESLHRAMELRRPLEFEFSTDDAGRARAMNAVEFVPPDHGPHGRCNV